MAVGVGDRELRSDRRGPLRDAGHHLDAGESHADRAVPGHAVADEQGGLTVERARAGEPADHGHSRGAAGDLLQRDVRGEAVRIGKQDHAGGAGEVRKAADGDAIRPLERLGMEAVRLAVVKRGGPDRDGGPVLDLPAVRDHAARSAAGEHGRLERLVDALERRLRRR